MKEEIWNNIEGFEGKYMVSSFGRVKSLNFGKETILKPRTDKDGYKLINLYKDKKSHTFKIHRLVAQAFIPNPDNKPHIDHINTNRTDNKVDNLRWCTPSENNLNPITYEKRIGENCYMFGIIGSKHRASKPVCKFTKKGIFIKEYDNAQEFAREHNLYSGSNVSSCCKGKLKTAYGYIWKYTEDIQLLNDNLCIYGRIRKRVG